MDDTTFIHGEYKSATERQFRERTVAWRIHPHAQELYGRTHDRCDHRDRHWTQDLQRMLCLRCGTDCT